MSLVSTNKTEANTYELEITAEEHCRQRFQKGQCSKKDDRKALR